MVTSIVLETREGDAGCVSHWLHENLTAKLFGVFYSLWDVGNQDIKYGIVRESAGVVENPAARTRRSRCNGSMILNALQISIELELPVKKLSKELFDLSLPISNQATEFIAGPFMTIS